MVRLGKGSPAVFEDVATYMQEQFESEGFSREELVVNWGKAAHSMRVERELFEKYGYMKDFVLHPFTQMCLAWIAKNVDWRPVGDPFMPFSYAVITLVMARGLMPNTRVLLLFACILFALNPIYVVAAAICYRLYASVIHPKAYRKPKRVDPDYATYLPEQWQPQLMPLEYDHIIVGNDLASYYTAALLSWFGRSCVVLEPLFALPQCIKVDSFASEIPIVDLSMARLKQYQHFLDIVCTQDTRITFSPIGTQRNRYAYKVLNFISRPTAHARALLGTPRSADKFILRPGIVALQNDLADKRLLDRTAFSTFITKVSSVYANLVAFLMLRFVPGGWASLTKEAKVFIDEAASTASDFLAKFPELSGLQMYLLGMFHEETLPASEVSTAALMSAVELSTGGMYYPNGGFTAIQTSLSRIIRRFGGAVFIGVPVNSIEAQEASAQAQPQVVGVRLDKGEVIRATHSVVSGVGVLCTFTHLLPKDIVPKRTEQILSSLKEQWPRIRVVVILEGSAEALGIGPEDYVELLAQEAEIHDDQESKATPGNVRSIQELREAYLKISFPSMRDVTWSTSNPNMHTCIIEQETPESWLKSVELGSGSGPVVYESANPQRSPAAGVGELPVKTETRKSIISTLLGRLSTVYPSINSSHIKTTVFVPPSVRCNPLSHTVHRYTRPITAHTELKGLYLTGEDLASASFAKGIQAGWAAANAVLGYSDPYSLLQDLQRARKRLRM